MVFRPVCPSHKIFTAHTGCNADSGFSNSFKEEECWLNRADQDSKNRFSKDDILTDVIGIIKNMTADWEIEFGTNIGPQTYLVAELEFKSIKLAQLASLMEEHFKNKDLPFQELIIKPDGRVVEDLQVFDIVDFLYKYLKAP
jgi:hypothetical protein